MVVLMNNMWYGVVEFGCILSKKIWVKFQFVRVTMHAEVIECTEEGGWLR